MKQINEMYEKKIVMFNNILSIANELINITNSETIINDLRNELLKIAVANMVSSKILLDNIVNSPTPDIKIFNKALILFIKCAITCASFSDTVSPIYTDVLIRLRIAIKKFEEIDFIEKDCKNCLYFSDCKGISRDNHN